MPQTFITLDRLQAYAKAYLDMEVVEHCADPKSVEIYVRSSLRGVVEVGLLRTYAAMKFDDVTVTYPRDWWQAFRQRWFPLWARRRWPIAYVRRVVQVYDAYPSIVVPPGHAPIRVVFDDGKIARASVQP